MKIPKITIALLTSLITLSSVAQDNPKGVKYRRSSLYMLMVEDPTSSNSGVISTTFKSSPIPDKFNDHNLQARAFDPSSITVTNQDREAYGLKASKQSKSKNLSKKMQANLSGGMVDTTNKADLPIKFDKYFNENNVARDLIAKWFNRKSNGTFDMKLIAERGSYDASALDINKAKGSKRGMATLADAGEELIGNTFVVVTRFKYLNKEELAQASKAVTGAAGRLIGSKVKGADQLGSVAGKAQDALAKGYIVQSTSYLYKLVWNDSVQAVFYQDYWMDESSRDEKRKQAFENSSIFKLELIGSEKAFADVQSNSFTKKTEDQLIARATEKSVDAVIAKLQREYEVFRTKTPLYSTDPATAKIGMKEGLMPGDKFEVLEQVMDEETGKTKYEKKGKLSVKGDLIWDNRMNAEEMAADTSKVKLDRTTFKGGKGLYPGMLIRQK